MKRFDVAKDLGMGTGVFRLPLQSVQGLLLGLARERSLDRLLDLGIHRLADFPDVALARVWLIQEGDICPSCPMSTLCAQNIPCLQLSRTSAFVTT